MVLKYFGTDGVRGVAYKGALTLEHVARWGTAWGIVAQEQGIQELVLGWDPRCSSEPIAQAFLHGLGDRLKPCVLGMVPTPAVAWATQQRSSAWGLMISASHNPPEDNGLKGFDERGDKLSESLEKDIESAYGHLAGNAGQRPLPTIVSGPTEAYLGHLGGIDLPEDFKLVLDCAHGATAPWAPRLFRGEGVEWLGCPADGARINVGVGSTHLEPLVAAVKQAKAEVGVAFDGDGDRCLLIAPDGTTVDGDQMLWLLVQDLLAQGKEIPGVVGTLMTNAGLEVALRGKGIPFVRTDVGDKFMVRELTKRGWDLAAEASGHLIQKHLGPSGDGMATALAALSALLRRPKAERWSWQFPAWPLRLVNLVVPERRPVEECTHLQAAQATLERSHGEDLRMVIRWSGTEPKLRLMVESTTVQLRDAALATLEAAALQDLPS